MYDQLRICCPTGDTFAVRVYQDPVRAPPPHGANRSPQLGVCRSHTFLCTSAERCHSLGSMSH